MGIRVVGEALGVRDDKVGSGGFEGFGCVDWGVSGWE